LTIKQDFFRNIKVVVPLDFTFSKVAGRSDLAPARWRRPFLKWLDGTEAGWAIPLLLVSFVILWTAFLVIAYLSGDLHPDVLETWTLGRTLEWGNSKHPSLVGWIVYLWTSVFPLTDWSFQLLAMTNSAIALWCVDLISRRFVRGDRRIIVLLLLMLTPVYQFHAQRFNANAVLLATWPFATYCFLRSFETRHLLWAIAAGATAALAMLGKYYSMFLIGSFVFAAIAHPQRRAYFSSLAPWVSTVAGLLVLAPHLHWLATTGATPVRYALYVHRGATFGESLIESAFFLLGLGASMAIPAITWIMIAGSRLKQFPADFRELNSGLLLLFFISVGTIVFPIITTGSLGSDLPSLWALQGLFLFVVLIVCGTRFPIQRFYSVNLAVMVLGMAAIAVVVAAPIHAIYRNTHPFKEGRNFYRQSSAELTRQWHGLSDAPLPLVSGTDALAFATVFYSPEHPEYVHTWDPGDSWAPSLANLKRGWAAMCFSDEISCITWMANHTPPSGFVRSEFSVQSVLMGLPGATRQVTALILPPDKGTDSTTK
jgi:4-amino-4-deoxy-L-arabinose transferase-like glycosyltransferase